MKVINNNLRKEDLEKIKEIVVTIDMIKGFVEEGALASKSIMRIVPVIGEILEETEHREDAINAFGNDWHTEDSLEFEVYGVHALKDTEEAEIIDQFVSYLSNGLEFKKNSTNVFFAPGFKEFIDSCPNLERITFVGCLSEYCVKKPAMTTKDYFDEHNRRVEVAVYGDAIDTFNAPEHDADEVTKTTLEELERNGIKVLRRVRKQEKPKYEGEDE